MKQKIMSAILVCILGVFLSCNVNVNGEMVKKSFIVIFAVEGDGNIVATIDGNKIDSGIVAEEGTIIEFKASFDEQKYEIDGWVGAKQNTFDKTRAKLIVSENITVELILKDKEAPKVTLNFSSGSNGKIRALIGDNEVYSGDRIPKGSTVNFEAIANDGYEVSCWDGATPNEQDKDHASAVARKDLSVSVLFTPIGQKDEPKK